MLVEHAEDLANFVNELQGETNRGLPLVGAALIDEKLLNTLESFFVEGKSSSKLLSAPNAPLGTFSSRIDACYSLALIDKFEYQEIGIIRKIRNEFAHAKHAFHSKMKKLKDFALACSHHYQKGRDLQQIHHDLGWLMQ